jgi:hypothetical protein
MRRALLLAIHLGCAASLVFPSAFIPAHASTIPITVDRVVSAYSEIQVAFGDDPIIDESFLIMTDEGFLDDARESSLSSGQSTTESSAAQTSFLSPDFIELAGSIQGFARNDEGHFICQSSPVTGLEYRFEVDAVTPFLFTGDLDATGGGAVVFRLDAAFGGPNIILEFAQGDAIALDSTGELDPGIYELRAEASAYISPGSEQSATISILGTFGGAVGVTTATSGPRFGVEPNRPNPFRPETTVRFSLDRVGPTTLTVYDVRGRRVRTLVDEDLPAGAHEVTWRGDDERGRRVRAGVYFYRLEADERQAGGRMVLVE